MGDYLDNLLGSPAVSEPKLPDRRDYCRATYVGPKKGLMIGSAGVEPGTVVEVYGDVLHRYGLKRKVEVEVYGDRKKKVKKETGWFEKVKVLLKWEPPEPEEDEEADDPPGASGEDDDPPGDPAGNAASAADDEEPQR